MLDKFLGAVSLLLISLIATLSITTLILVIKATFKPYFCTLKVYSLGWDKGTQDGTVDRGIKTVAASSLEEANKKVAEMEAFSGHFNGQWNSTEIKAICSE